MKALAPMPMETVDLIEQALTLEGNTKVHEFRSLADSNVLIHQVYDLDYSLLVPIMSYEIHAESDGVELISPMINVHFVHQLVISDWVNEPSFRVDLEEANLFDVFNDLLVQLGIWG